MSEQRTITGIDIGCSGVKCVTALQDDEGGLEIVGAGMSLCTGHIREGVLVNASIAGDAAAKAIEEAEETSGLEIETAFVGITGLHVRGILGSSTLVIGDGRGEELEAITGEDVKRVVEAAGSITLPSGCRVLERTPRDYSFEGFHNLPDPPVGLRASSLQARVYTIYADRIAVENLVSVIENAGVSVQGVIPSAIASAEAVLNDDEKSAGTVVIDMGASNTDLVVYQGGAPVHIASFALGGNRMTADIQSLGISWADAEKLKIENVTALKTAAESKSISVRKVGGRGSISVGLPVLTQIASGRVEEIFRYAGEEIAASGAGMENLTGGIVITGGGARMKGILDAASEITGQMVEPGIPRGFTSGSKLVNTPEMATAVGLVKHGSMLMRRTAADRENGDYRSMMSRFRDFFNKLK